MTKAQKMREMAICLAAAVAVETLAVVFAVVAIETLDGLASRVGVSWTDDR